jgi:hypothetical protein
MPCLYLTRESDNFSCKIPFGGLHITIVGRGNRDQLQVRLPLVRVLLGGKYHWVPNKQTIFRIKNFDNGSWAICFKSNTLDKMSLILSGCGLKNVKGPFYSSLDWHITIPNCHSESEALEYLDMFER